MEYYEQLVDGEISNEEFRTVQDLADKAREILLETTKQKTAYEKKYYAFRKLLSASNRDIPPGEIMNYIDEIAVDEGRMVVLKWNHTLN